MTLIHSLFATPHDIQRALNESREDLKAAFGNLGAPVDDFLATIYSARATMLGAACGKRFYHHELAVRIPMPEHLEPEVQVWDQGTLPVWQNGVLEEPKYFSFFQDAPHAAFNPNYRGQWRAHELLHGAVGFFWRPDMTRFEYYVAARINEMLPVVHWYGLDEVARPRCQAHRNQTWIREFCPHCEALSGPWWTHDPTTLNDIDPFIELARTYLELESAACAREIETARIVPNRTAHLDPSSDAIGYLRGHWNRCTGWSFGAWAERFLTSDDVFDSCDVLLENARHVFDQLLEGPLRFDPVDASRRAEKRLAQDLAYRALLVLEWSREGKEEIAEALMEPVLEHLEAVVHGDETLAPWTPEELNEVVPGELVSILWSNGFTPDTPSITQVLEGLQTAFVSSANVLTTKTASMFVDSDEFKEAGRLDARFAKFASSHAMQDSHVRPVEDALRLEAWLQSEPRVDMIAEEFGAVPEALSEIQPGELRLHETLHRGTFHRDSLDEIGEFEGLVDGYQEVARIRVRGAARILPVNDAIARVLENPDSAAQSGDAELLNLLEHGFVVWLPLPRKA